MTPPTLVYLALAQAGLTLPEVNIESWKIMKTAGLTDSVEVKVKYREKDGKMNSIRKTITLEDQTK